MAPGRWLLVHYAQIVLFPLAALAMAGLVHGQTGVAAAVCRVAMFVFAASYVAFDTAAGVVTGVLVEAAHRSPVLLLAVCSFGIAVFKTHAWPGGPITFGRLGLAALWAHLEGSWPPRPTGSRSPA